MIAAFVTDATEQALRQLNRRSIYECVYLQTKTVDTAQKLVEGGESYSHIIIDLNYFNGGQHALLMRTVAALKQRGITPQTVHCCNSAATFAQPAFHHDMVRAGIILYGENPSSETTLPGLRPAMQLKAVISQVKDICAGDAESYGRTFTASTPMRVATVTVGYADGYARLLSNTGTMSVRGCPARILGRVCMDQTIVDVTNIPDAAEGDEVTVYGGAAADSVERVAELTGTINYEVVCAVSRRVPRVYVAQGREVACANYLTGE